MPKIIRLLKLQRVSKMFSQAVDRLFRNIKSIDIKDWIYLEDLPILKKKNPIVTFCDSHEDEHPDSSALVLKYMEAAELKSMVGPHLRSLALFTWPFELRSRLLGGLLAAVPNLRSLRLSNTYFDEKSKTLHRLKKGVQKAGLTALTSVRELHIKFLRLGCDGDDFPRPLNLKKTGVQILMELFPSLKVPMLEQLYYDLTEFSELGKNLETFKKIAATAGIKAR
eukprot:TRINITY_DN4191_c0_g1_i1.p1 TRINITY_DN4191_c0_g1~~TRINITY_DN4191_c0_g1_i1.p1  ORF type:complete len:224 (-),score=25.12 TRINITY_DN4191_c0_g1_i1:62-733(-)